MQSHELDYERPEAGEVLRELHAAKSNPERLRRAVIDAESLDFSPDEARELIGLLRHFISTYRHSTEPIDITVVGSAIRTLIAIIPIDQLDCIVAELLDDAAQPSLRVDITVAKMIVRKLVANPTACPDPYDILKRFLWGLEAKYLDDRTIETRGHGAVAMDTVLALALVGTPDFSVILDRLRSFDAAWFRQLVAREATRLATDFSRSSYHASCSRIIRSLNELAVAAVPTAAV
ncbi:hypothetical protein OJF2_30890 [Aquisphaera giovannonii]|uniref:Uncharacterized protein n=1 Tax=Aquisphaera giovannonii TaxID=406548 RepID=A0A5B9W2M7_9BACT|nr:hypothetical protein [Aquisphaera giovannonii]QEH34549.1 hypothetical protein OJF2_30890 [Aquisphaera giovannonii]